MITHTEEVKEHREDGSLMYECTKAYLSPNSAYLYDQRIKQDNGKSFIRIKHATKYKKDGSIEWRLIHNNKGDVIGNAKGSITGRSFK